MNRRLKKKRRTDLYCVWCNRHLSRLHNCDTRLTRDHLIPKALGGGNGRNIVLACIRCNGQRATDTNWVQWDAVELLTGSKPNVGAAYAWVDGVLQRVEFKRRKKKEEV